MSFLGSLLPNQLLVSPGIKNFRMAQCNNCKYFKNGFCGTPIIGDFINHNGKTAKLCGCKMSEKTELKSASCAINRW